MEPRIYIRATDEFSGPNKSIPAPILRKAFELDFVPEEAELSISTNGFYDLYINFVSEDGDEEGHNSNAALNVAFKSLLDVKGFSNCELYVIFDSYSDNPRFEFFADYDSMASNFGENYISINME